MVMDGCWRRKLEEKLGFLRMMGCLVSGKFGVRKGTTSTNYLLAHPGSDQYSNHPLPSECEMRPVNNCDLE